MDEKVVVWILPDNKLCEDFPSETRYFLAIVEKDFIKLVEEHTSNLFVEPARVVNVDLDPLQVTCKVLFDKDYVFKFSFVEIQKIAYRNLWYEKVMGLVLNT